MSFRLRLVLGLGVGSGVLLACNAIVGVEDVRLRATKGLPDSGDGPTPPDPTNEGGGGVTGPDRGSLAMGDGFVCARLPTGSVKCWGDNTSGQLGDGLDAGTGTNPAKFPQAVRGLTDVVDIAAGGGHTCAAKRDGSVVCWGRNSDGELGNDTTATSTVPVAVAGLDHATGVAASSFASCALKDDKTVMCWGSNTVGELGTGDNTPALHAVPVVGLANVARISGGAAHVCAVDTSANVWCWGSNTYGQLGNGSTSDSPTPVKVAALSGITQVAAGYFFTCAVQNTGKVYCWGVNDHGQLGNGSTSPTATANPAPNFVAGGLGDAVNVSTNGNNHACAVRQNGSLACWGDSTSGQLGYSATVDGSVPTPAPVASLTNGQRVWTSGDTSCAITSDGRAWCWGSNQFGQIGDNTTVTRFLPTQVSSFP